MSESIIKSIIPDYVGTSLDMVFKNVLPCLSIFIHTDAGAEIDDEIALGYFLFWLINCQSNIDIHVLVSVKTGTSGVKRLIDYGFLPIAGVSINSEWNFQNVINIVGTEKTITLVFHDGTTFVPDNYRMNYIGSISPGLDSVLKPCNLTGLRGFSHQGLLGDPGWYGFNETGTVQILKSLKESMLPRKVAKPLNCFREFLFSRELLAEHSIPQSLFPVIAADAFKNIIGRFPPTVPDHIKHLFATLVNLKLADKYNKPGTNKRLADMIRTMFPGPVILIDEATKHKIMSASISYVDMFPNEDREGTIQSVYDLTLELAEMGMPYLHYNDDGSYRLIYSSDGNLAELYHKEFEVFVGYGIATPGYDLKAMINLKDLLLEQNALCQ